MVKYYETRECGDFIEVVYRIRKETALMYNRVHKCMELNCGFIEIKDGTVYDEIRNQIVDESRVICDTYGKHLVNVENALRNMSDNGILEEKISPEDIEARANEIMDIVCPVLIISKDKPTIFYFLDRDLYTVITELSEYLSDDYKRKYTELCKLAAISFRQSMDSRMLLSIFLGIEVEEEKITKTYLMKDKTGLYKIGRSYDPYQRLKDIRCGNSSVELICEIDRDIEKELHQEYSDKRIKGEWFKLSENDVKEIIKLSKH